MIHELFIRTLRRDFPYLKYCLKSIGKFATGLGVTLAIPRRDEAAMRDFLRAEAICLDGIRLIHFDEREGKGMLHGMYLVMIADLLCPEADYLYHIDSDCIFTAPVTPYTFWKEGRPILRLEHFNSIGARHGGVFRWKLAAEKALPFPVDYECMRGHPEVYHHRLYPAARELIERKTGKALFDYIMEQDNAFPQTFAEFPTLGAVALARFPQDYTFVDMAKQPNPDFHDTPLVQFWSHGPVDQSQPIWVEGRVQEIVPLAYCQNLGL